MRLYEFTVYNVGQGLCTTLEGTKDNGEDYFAIFDCGTIQQGAASTDRIVEDMIEKANQKEKIDGIVISHQDTDHWSMLFDIIWKYYDVRDTYIVCNNLFYFQKNRNVTHIYERNGDFIEYSYHSIEKTGSLDFETAVAPDGTIREFHAYAEYGENPDLGQCIFHLEKSDSSGELMLHVSIDRVYARIGSSFQNIIYHNCFTIETEGLAFTEGNWEAIVNCIEKNHVYEKVEEEIGFQKYFRAHYYDFLSLLLGISFCYQKMGQFLSRETNFNNNKNPIGTILMGGDFWEIGYRRLYSILKKLVDTGLVECVNGYRKGIESFDDSVRFCGLLRMSEDTFPDNIDMEEISVDENLLDPFSELPTADTPAILHNASSLIVDFELQEDDYILFPGDATVHDFASLAEKLSQRTDGVTMFMAPHHGSDHTNYCSLLPDQKQPLHVLLDALNSDGREVDACIVSALASKFGHPGERFMNDVLRKMYYDKEDKHRACYVKNGRKCEFETMYRFYCTETFTGILNRWYPEDEDTPPQTGIPHKNGGFV